MFDYDISRRAFLRHTMAMMGLGVAATAGLGLAGCGGGSSDAGKNGELNIFIWSEYVPDDLISDFEKESGIKVNASMFNTNENMLAKFKSGEEGAYDILQPTGYMVKQMADQGLLEKMDTGKLKNLGNIGKQYLKRDFDPDNSYSVPYMGSCTAIAYDKTKLKTAPDSWETLWDAQFKNSLVVLDDPREVLGFTNIMLGFSVNESDPAKLEQTRAKVMELKPNIKVYDADSPKSSLIAGDVTAGGIWTAETALAQDEQPNIQVAYPKEGCNVGIDSWVIPKGAKNVDNAMQFIDFMLKPENAKRVSEAYPYVQPNTAAIDLLDDDFKSNKAKNVPAEVFEKGQSFATLDSDTLKIYNDIWTELKK